MYIDKVRLTNIRGFRDLEFSFDRGNGTYAGWTVLTGDNGSGKSTLLKSIAIALTGNNSVRLQPSFSRWIQAGAAIGKIELDVFFDWYAPALVGVTLKENPSRREDEPILKENQVQSCPKDLPDDEAPEFAFHEEPWFACGYGPSRRVFGETNRQKISPLLERFSTLFKESESLAEVDEWLRNLSHKTLEGHTDEKASLDLVLELLSDNLLPNKIIVDRVDSDGLWLKDRNGTQLTWSEMSDGYRAALALMADILRHLINNFGIEEISARDVDGHLFVKPSGIVLIDEIDAHLHPEWQREIGFWLKKRFPNIQFIVTSHSPLICQAADPNGLFVLPEPGSDEPARALTPEEYQEVISSRPDTILRSAAFGLQNTRSPVAVEARSAYADLRTKQRAGGKLTKTELAELERLRQYINPDEEP